MQKTKVFILAFVAWEWISSVTKSLFKLASYVVELPMVASGVYIMIATGVPGWNNPGTFNLAMAVLLAAPEILAPGAFFRAETMQSRGKTRAARVTRYLAGAMLFFAALTFSSIMIFHWDSNVMQGIMFFRVMTSLGYSIITRIDMEHGGLPKSTVNPLEGFTLVGIVAMLEQVHSEQQSLVNQIMTQVNRANQDLLDRVNHQVNQFNLEQMAELHRQNQETVSAAIEHLEKVNSGRLEAVWTQLRQVTVTLESNPSLPAVNTGKQPLSLPSRGRTVNAVIPPAVNQESKPEEGFTDEQVNQGSEGLQSNKVNLARTFTVNHYQVNQQLPALALIMSAAICSKGLASRIRKSVAQELGIEG